MPSKRLPAWRGISLELRPIGAAATMRRAATSPVSCLDNFIDSFSITFTLYLESHLPVIAKLAEEFAVSFLLRGSVHGEKVEAK